MKMGLYPRLAADGIRRNRRVYLPYLLTLAGTAAAFYIITALASAGDLPVMTRYMYLSLFMSIGTVVIAVFAVIFLTYSASFLMKSRRRELALYNVLGMGKGHIARMLLIETAYAALAGIGGGLLLGMLLQKLVTMLLCRIMGTSVWFRFHISGRGVCATAILFSAILLLNLLLELLRLGRQSPAELLREGSAGEREPRTRAVFAVLGVLCLGGGYGIAVFARSAGMAFALYFPAVILVILGTYALFSAVSIAVLKGLRRNKRYYYQTSHFIGVSGMLYRMRRNAVGLANLCILSTMVLVMVSGTLSLYLCSQRTLEKQFPGQLEVTVRYRPEESLPFDGEAADSLLRAALEREGAPAETVYAYQMLSMTMRAENGGYTFAVYPAAVSDPLQICLLTAADAGTAGCAVGDFEPVTLRFPADQAACGGQPGGHFLECTVNAARLTAGEPAVGADFVSAAAPLWLALEDGAALRAVYDAHTAACAALNTGNADRMTWRVFYRLDLGEEALMALPSALESDLVFDAEVMGGWERAEVDTRAEFSRDYFSINGGFFFLGLFLGLLFIMAAVLIIYYKQISEGYEDRTRFRIMQEVGLEPDMVRRSIRSQVLTVFFAPLLVAAVHVAFDFGLMLRLLTMFGLHEPRATLLCTAGTFLAFAALYAEAFALTARVYERIVGGRQN